MPQTPALLNMAPLFADDGRLHKAVRVNHGVHIIEEIRLFPDGQPILQLLLDQDQAGARARGALGAQPAWGRSCLWAGGERRGKAGVCRSPPH